MTKIILPSILLLLSIFLIYLGIQYLFNTENFCNKVVKFNNYKINSSEYNFYKNSANMSTHKLRGIIFLIGGLIMLGASIFKIFNEINLMFFLGR
jgi:hypothetical protein